MVLEARACYGRRTMAQAALHPLPLFAAVATALSLFVAGCGTSAKGIDTCREIEEERCRQAPACPDQFRVRSESEVESCVRFYRDQCLHGLSAEEPGKPALDACLQTIRRAGACAKAGSKTLDDCNPRPSAETKLATACEVLVHPEQTAECAFLVPPVEQPPVTQPTEDAAADAPASEDGG